MSDQTITSLIEKLEGAEVGSRELDALVSVALKLDCKPNLTDDLHFLRPTRKDDCCAPGTYWFVQRSGMSLRTSDPVTTSLDAALALAERLELSVGEILNDALEGPAGVGIWQSGWNGTISTIPQIARFVCIAILRAQSEARV